MMGLSFYKPKANKHACSAGASESTALLKIIRKSVLPLSQRASRSNKCRINLFFFPLSNINLYLSCPAATLALCLASVKPSQGVPGAPRAILQGVPGASYV